MQQNRELQSKQDAFNNKIYRMEETFLKGQEQLLQILQKSHEERCHKMIPDKDKKLATLGARIQELEDSLEAANKKIATLEGVIQVNRTRAEMELKALKLDHVKQHNKNELKKCLAALEGILDIMDCVHLTSNTK